MKNEKPEMSRLYNLAMDKKMRIYYDEEGDYLTIFTGKSRPNYGEDVESDNMIFQIMGRKENWLEKYTS